VEHWEKEVAVDAKKKSRTDTVLAREN